MKDIILMKWDNCYTFVLKVLGIFDVYQKIESDSFVDLHKEKLEPFNAGFLADFDIIIQIRKRGPTKYLEPRAIKNGCVVIKPVHCRHYHFAVYHKGIFYELLTRDTLNSLQAVWLGDFIAALDHDKNDYKVLSHKNVSLRP